MSTEFMTSASITQFRKYVGTTGRSRSTSRAYHSDLVTLQRWHQEQPETLPAPTPSEVVRDWLADSLSSRSANTVRRRKASASVYLKWLGINDELEFRLPGAPLPNPTPVPNGMDGVREMIAAADDPRKRALVVLCGQMGLRVSEAVSIKGSDYDPENGVLHVFGKGSKFRSLPVPEGVHDDLMELINVRPHGPLLGVANTAARGWVKELASKVGFGVGVSSHDLRATFATDMYRRTKDIVVVQQWLGHSSPETTRRYVQVTLDSMRAALS